MALSTRNFCLQKNYNYLFFKNKYFNVLRSQNSVRYLRGTRLGRELDKTEAKFRELIKNLKVHSKKSVLSTLEVPQIIEKSGEQKESQDEDTNSTLTKKPILSTLEVSERIEKSVKQKESQDEETNSTLPKSEEDPFSVYDRLAEKITPMRRFTYPVQLKKKYKKSLMLLRMFGEKLRAAKTPITLGQDRLPCPVELMLPSPVIEQYRNHDEFSIGTGIDGNPKTVGFYLNSILDDSKTVCVGPEGLIIIKENHKLFVKDFEKYIRNSPLPATARHDDGGYWKSLIVKTNESSDLMGIIIMNSQDLTKDQLEDEKNKLREHFETSGLDYNLKSLYFHTWNGIEKMPYDLLFGEPYIIEEFDRFKLRISPESYLLANTYAARIIHDSLKKFCRVYESTTLLDISCGTGPISFSFSPHVKKCIGIDSCFQSIADAKYNAELNKEESVTFIHGNVEMVLPEIFEDNRDDLVAVINSSRTELNKTTFKFLRKCKHLKKIIFISTKPDVDIANFERLCRPAGKESYLGKYFVPLLAIPVDMFPQTKQYGLIMMFQRL